MPLLSLPWHGSAWHAQEVGYAQAQDWPLTQNMTQMNITNINPDQDWGANFQFSQGILAENFNRVLNISGQIAAETDPASPLGLRVLHPGDIRKQTETALEKIDFLLDKAGMKRQNLWHVRLYTTDTAAFLQHYEVYAQWVGAAGVTPANTL